MEIRFFFTFPLYPSLQRWAYARLTLSFCDLDLIVNKSYILPNGFSTIIALSLGVEVQGFFALGVRVPSAFLFNFPYNACQKSPTFVAI